MKGKLVLMGDFNASDIDWGAFSAGNRDKEVSEALVDLALAFELTQIVEASPHTNNPY